jgi:GT2 family glycosyltransferase
MPLQNTPGGDDFLVKPEAAMGIATIIVNYNAGEMLAECVHALLESTEATAVTVVDNASSDRSAENLRSLYGNHQGIEFLFNQENIGFAPAVNLVARRSQAEWILILNPDCILEPEALKRLKTALEADSTAGLAGPSVLDGDGNMQRATRRRFPDPWKSLMATTGLWRLGKWLPVFHGVEVHASESSIEVEVCDAVSGACMLLRRSALLQVDYMDEDYAMHCEDLDLMFRLKQDGWHCLFVPQASCVHLQGLSSSSRPTWVHFQKHRGMARFYKKFQARTSSIPTRLLVYSGIWLRFLVLWPLVLIRR